MKSSFCNDEDVRYANVGHMTETIKISQRYKLQGHNLKNRTFLMKSMKFTCVCMAKIVLNDFIIKRYKIKKK